MQDKDNMINTGTVMPSVNQSKLAEKQCLEHGFEKNILYYTIRHRARWSFMRGI
jgi:hypothetical protein